MAEVKGSTRMSQDRSDLTPAPDLTRERRTGPFRTQRPIYVDLLPPCNHACPAGENIQAWLGAAQGGRFEEAWRILVADNPMPAVHGRVCYHPCEDGCNRRHLDSAVSIHAVERFLGDAAIEHGWQFERAVERSGRRVLVVGGGPSGLAATYHLARLGHEVEIRDAGPTAGGMMHFGIPAYRMPRAILEVEIGKIEQLGVRITSNHRVEDVEAEMKEGRFDACFVAVGAHLSKRTEIPACDAAKMLDAVSFLRDVESQDISRLGRVVVYGGGNTAMDAARAARRLGASEAMIIYRRDRAHMPAHEFEAAEAEAEGVEIHWLRTIKSIDRTTFTVEVMAIGEDGRPKPTGEVEALEADTLIMALGQASDTDFLKKLEGVEFQKDGTVVVDRDLMIRRAPVVHPVDPGAAEIAQRRQVLVGRQKLGLEPPHLAGGRRLPVDSVAADDPAHDGIARQTATKAAEHGLAEQARHAMPSVLAGATVDQDLAPEVAQSKNVVEFPIGKQTSVGGDPGTVELELDPAVEIDPKRLLRFTHRVRHDRPAQPVTTH